MEHMMDLYCIRVLNHLIKSLHNKYKLHIVRLHNKYKSISFILSKHRLNKFRRDGLDIWKAIMLLWKTESNFQKLTEIDTNSNITDNVNSSQSMPSYNPINLDKNNNILSDGLKSLCSKGPLYVPVHLTIIG